jgi:DNA-binding NtrC family response regulator
MKSLQPHGTATVMVVEDQPEVRALTIRILELAGYTVVGVDNGRTAVALLRKQPVDLMVLDMILEPSFNGLNCYREAVAIRPGQKAIFVSGCTDMEWVAEARRLGAGRHIQKPFTIISLLEAVRDELGDW